MSIPNIKHAKSTSWNREYYTINENQNTGSITVTTRTLNIFQRIIRFLFGAFSDTILTQKKIDQLWTNKRTQRGKLTALVQKLDALGKKFILPEADNIRNILVVGHSKAGKTSMGKILENPFFTVSKKCDFSASTWFPVESKLQFSGNVFNILETPGLNETWRADSGTESRDDEEISSLIQNKVREIFGGQAFENVDVVMMTFPNDTGITMREKDCMDQFLSKMLPETKKLLVFTCAERLMSQEKKEIRQELLATEGIEEYFKEDKNILFSGAFSEENLNYQEAESQKTFLDNISLMREDLIDALLPDTLSKQERQNFKEQRENASETASKALFQKIRKQASDSNRSPFGYNNIYL